MIKEKNVEIFMKEEKYKLICEGNAFYEIDLECQKKKEQKERERKNRNEKTERNGQRR